jgi:membrane protein implicated in regulation of membrane protease activity
MSTVLTVVIALLAIAALAVVISMLKRRRTESDRRNAQLEAEVEGHRGSANERRREASRLAGVAGKLSARADELDEQAGKEVEAARLDEERLLEARKKVKK